MSFLWWLLQRSGYTTIRLQHCTVFRHVRSLAKKILLTLAKLKLYLNVERVQHPKQLRLVPGLDLISKYTSKYKYEINQGHDMMRDRHDGQIATQFAILHT